MPLQLTYISKRLSALRAVVRFAFSMDPHVSITMSFILKLLLTKIALKAFFLPVGFPVHP